jgi:hypothetical protein
LVAKAEAEVCLLYLSDMRNPGIDVLRPRADYPYQDPPAAASGSSGSLSKKPIAKGAAVA